MIKSMPKSFVRLTPKSYSKLLCQLLIINYCKVVRLPMKAQPNICEVDCWRPLQYFLVSFANKYQTRVDMAGSGKRSSLLYCRIIFTVKSFYKAKHIAAYPIFIERQVSSDSALFTLCSGDTGVVSSSPPPAPAPGPPPP